MKILHLSNTPLSNAPDNLVRCLNHCGHQATLLLNKKSNTNKVHVGGALWHGHSYEDLQHLFENTDVIHFHNYAWDLQIFKAHPDLLAIARTKPAVVQYHSPRRSTENFESSITDHSLKHAVLAQYHTREYPEAEFVVPNVIPLFDTRYQPLPAKWDSYRIPTVSYAPSNTTLKGWDNKGHAFTQPVLDRLSREGRIVPETMVGVPYEECMSRKRWAHIGVDEVATGSYHLSGLEYLAMGVITVGRMDELTTNALRQIVGEEGIRELPWFMATPDTLEAVLRQLSGSPKELLEHKAKNSREWMETYWHPAKLVGLFERMYQTL